MISTTDSTSDNGQQPIESSTEALNTVSQDDTMPNTAQSTANQQEIEQFDPETLLAAFWEVVNSNAAGVAPAPNLPISATASPMLQAQHERTSRLFTDTQRAIMNARYEQNNCIHLKERKELGEAIGLDEKQIRIWFQNRRVKDRKLNSD